jgi:hypothetical protein
MGNTRIMDFSGGYDGMDGSGGGFPKMLLQILLRLQPIS